MSGLAPAVIGQMMNSLFAIAIFSYGNFQLEYKVRPEFDVFVLSLLCNVAAMVERGLLEHDRRRLRPFARPGLSIAGDARTAIRANALVRNQQA